MCMVSFIGTQFAEQWRQNPHTIANPGPSRSDFDALKAEVEALKELLLAAKKFDEANGEPDCEMDEKVATIRKVAELVGVDMDAVFGDAQ